MKSIYLSDSDKETIEEFIKQHEELFNKTHVKFKDKQRKEGLWERLAASRNLSVNTVKNWFETQCTRLTQTKSGQAAVKSSARQPWLKNRFSFLQGHIRRKGVSKSSVFKSPLRPSAAKATASVPDTSRETESGWKSAGHQMLLISRRPQAFHTEQLLSPPLLLKIQV